MLKHHFSFELFADYFQFYVQDGGIQPEAPVDWTEEDVARRVKAADHVVAISTARNTTVPVLLELHDGEPTFIIDGIDHAVHCSVDLPTGKLQVHECTGGEVLRYTVAPGTYGMTILFAGLGSVDASGLDGHDTYRIALWPSEASRPVTIIKAWSP